MLAVCCDAVQPVTGRHAGGRPDAYNVSLGDQPDEAQLSAGQLSASSSIPSVTQQSCWLESLTLSIRDLGSM